MKKHCMMLLGTIVVAGLSLGPVRSAQALFLDLQSTGTSLHPVASVWVNARGPSAIGSFDVTVAFDSSLLAVHGVTFGSDLGDLGLSALALATPGSGTVNAWEISLLDPSFLLANQPDSFLLFTMDFGAVGTGISPLTFSSVILSDELGDPLSPGLLDGIIETQANPIPEPGTFLLLGAGLAALALRRRNRRS